MILRLHSKLSARTGGCEHTLLRNCNKILRFLQPQKKLKKEDILVHGSFRRRLPVPLEVACGERLTLQFPRQFEIYSPKGVLWRVAIPATVASVSSLQVVVTSQQLAKSPVTK